MNPATPPGTLFESTVYPLIANGDTVFGSDKTCGPAKLSRHQRIAGRHLVVRMSAAGATLRDLGAGTNVNGRWVVGRSVPLQVGDGVDIGPLALRFTGNSLESFATMSLMTLSARNVSHTVREKGRTKELLSDISLVLKPGQFACVLGPSGCGKSTLLAALSGRAQPNGPHSVIQLNRRNLYPQFEQLKQNLVFVPQKTVVHGELTVLEVLRYTARLRLPPTADRAARIEEVLKDMRLGDIRHVRVKRISGGQEKRLCLANELLADPGLILLDEVTSGLDELTDHEMMWRFNRLADAGKTVACVTHSLAHVMETCHLVVVLGPGGRLAFVGPPARALTYFGIAELRGVYALFGGENDTPEAKRATAAERAATFLESTDYRDYVLSRLEAEAAPPPAAPPPGGVVRELPAEALLTVRQAAICTRRSLTIFRRDRPAIVSLVVQTLLVAGILIAAFGALGDFPPKPKLDDNETKAAKHFPNYVHKDVLKQTDYVRKLLNLTFLLGVTSFWFGCNNAAKEIVRERTISRQEQMFNLRALGYFASKLLILTVVTWIQATVLLLLVWKYCHPPGDVRAFVPMILAIAFVGTAMGLAISALAPSEGVAVALIPIAVIPQIILSGAIVTLTGGARLAGELFVTTYWGKRGLDALTQGEVGDFAREESIKLIDATTVTMPYAAMGVHAIVLCAIAVAALMSSRSLWAILGGRGRG